MSEETDIISLFSDYRNACRHRLDICESFQMKEATLEMILTELMEHNELLMKTIVELQNEAKNRAIEMEKRLSVSAVRTEEVVLAMNDYEMDIKKIVNDRISQIEAGDLIDELNSHIVALNVENNYLREQNDNLKHDLSNLIEMMRRKIGDDNSHDTKTECLTFCDVDPEDIFGPIEAIVATNCNSSVDEEVQVDDRDLSRSSSVASNQKSKYHDEEKEVLIKKLQEHLQTISRELELKDEVLKNLEAKLNAKRKDNDDVKSNLIDLNSKYEDSEKSLREANERINVLNEHKRSLMTQLDDESEQRIKFMEELRVMNARLADNMKTVEQQSITIQHLREAIVNKSKSDSTHLNGISISSQSQHQDL